MRTRLRRAGADICDVDGVRVRTGDGWWLLRPSNTEDMLVARCEASTPAGLHRVKFELLDHLDMSGFAADGIRRMLDEQDAA